MKKIVGVDVGKKNLAFCIINKQDGKLIDVVEWTKINVVDEVKKCDGIQKNKKTCHSKPTLHVTIDNITKCYCDRHKSQHVIDQQELDTHIIKCENAHCTYNKCKKKATYVVYDIVCCVPHKNILLKNKIKELSLKPIPKLDCSNIDSQVLCANIFNTFNNHPHLKTVDIVNIENQPPYKNPSMKATAAYIFAYFVFLNIHYNLNITIQYVSPTTKIKYDDEFTKFVNSKIEEHNKTKKATCKCKICKLNAKMNVKMDEIKFDYDDVKLLGIFQTEKTLLEHNMVDKFKFECAKIDDLCDAFLHANK